MPPPRSKRRPSPKPRAGAHGRLLLPFFQAAREGRFAGVAPLLAGLLDRKPRTVRDLLAERAAT
jgi:hypothetical protein